MQRNGALCSLWQYKNNLSYKIILFESKLCFSPVLCIWLYGIIGMNKICNNLGNLKFPVQSLWKNIVKKGHFCIDNGISFTTENHKYLFNISK